VFCVAMAGVVVCAFVTVVVFSVVAEEWSAGKKVAGCRREEYQRECDCWSRRVSGCFWRWRGGFELIERFVTHIPHCEIWNCGEHCDCCRCSCGDLVSLWSFDSAVVT
jgi:hypothetical protein